MDRRGCIGIVLATSNTPTYPIIFAVKASGSRYKGRPADFKAVIGKADVAAFQAACVASEPIVTCPDIFLPEPLKSMNLKPGDKIKVRHGGTIVEAIYQGYKFSRPKYPISYTIDGRNWKGTAMGILGKAA